MTKFNLSLLAIFSVVLLGANAAYDKMRLRPVTPSASCVTGELVVSSADSKLKYCSGGLFAGVDAAGAGSTSDSRNYILNSEFRFWQRQVPGTPTSRQDDAYGPDRWYYLTSGGAVNVQGARAAEVISSTPTPYVGQFRQADATARQYGVAQIVESDLSIGLRSKEVTLAFYARTSSSAITTIRACIGEWTSTADTVTSDIVSSWAATPTFIANFACINTPADITISSTMTQFTVTATFGSSVNNAVVFIWTPNTEAQNDYFYLTQVQLVQGASAFTWPIIRLSYAQELREVQRFYEKSYGVDIEPAATSSGGGYLTVTNSDSAGSRNVADSGWYRVTKRTTSPTVTAYNITTGTSGQCRASDANNLTATTATGQNSVYIQCGSVNAFVQAFVHWTVDAEL